MAKKTQYQIEQENEYFANILAHRNREYKKDNQKKSLISREKLLKVFLDGYQDYFLKNIDSYLIKTKSKNQNKQMIELVKYAFNKFNVPVFMNEAWEINERDLALIDKGELVKVTKPKTIYKDWYICMAQGGSLYKKHFKDFLTKKETHIFTACNYDLSIKKVIVYAIAKAESNNDGISLRIAQSRISERNMNIEFWRNVVRFFARNTPKSTNDINDLLDYLTHKREENQEYTVLGQGFTLDSLTKKMEDWHRDLRRLKAIGNDTWEGVPLENKIYEAKDSQGEKVFWVLTQLKSSKALQAEGNAQRHCVFSYKTYCINGHLSIWSLTFINKDGLENRKLTIELNNRDQIVQARGLANRSARNDENAILQRWARDENLKLAYK